MTGASADPCQFDAGLEQFELITAQVIHTVANGQAISGHRLFAICLVGL
jgi:hypothetical protein